MSEQDQTSSTNGQANDAPSKTPPQSKSGWDGKLRVNKQAVLANPEALSDPEYSDEDAPSPEQIDADEGKAKLPYCLTSNTHCGRLAGKRRP